jgi:hypothetical protein
VDLGFLPESEVWALFEGGSGREIGQGGKVPVGLSKKAATHGDIKTALPILLKDLAHENLIIVTHAARTIELLGKEASSAAPQMRKALEHAEKIRPPDLSPVIVLPGDKDLAMFVAFSCQAFLDGLEKK